MDERSKRLKRLLSAREMSMVVTRNEIKSKRSKDLFCTICLEYVKKKDSIALLSCGHALHLSCYDEMTNSWIPLKCPECRKPIGPRSRKR